MVKRNLHFSAPEELVLWVNWRLFFWFVYYLLLFYGLIFNNINTLSSHQILTNLRPNLIFGARIGVLVQLWFLIDNEKRVRFLTFCWVSLTVGKTKWISGVDILFAKLSVLIISSNTFPWVIYAAKHSDINKNNWKNSLQVMMGKLPENCLFLLWRLSINWFDWFLTPELTSNRKVN